MTEPRDTHRGAHDAREGHRAANKSPGDRDRINRGRGGERERRDVKRAAYDVPQIRLSGGVQIPHWHGWAIDLHARHRETRETIPSAVALEDCPCNRLDVAICDVESDSINARRTASAKIDHLPEIRRPCSPALCENNIRKSLRIRAT